MYAIIDLENMRFVYAHPDQAVLRNLDRIELAHVCTGNFDVSSHEIYNCFTDLELKLLYRNTFGVDSIFNRDSTIRVLVHNADDLPVVDVVPLEVLLQARSLADADRGFYRYVKGSNKPLPLDEALAVPAIRLKHVPMTAPPAPAKPPATCPTGPSAAQTPAVNTKVAATPREPRAPGGARPRINEVADRMWAEAGSPRDATVVLALRRKMMDELEKEGIKRTTSSTALGEWQKSRLA